ncbi:hypothetical protein WA588_005326, partial [Blastocystis sp. NMH]
LPFKFRYLDPHYVANYLVILSYFVTRSYYITPSSPLLSREKSWVGLTREVEIFLLFSVIQLKSIIRQRRLDVTIDSLLWGLKLAILSLVFQMDKTVAVVYVVLYTFIFLLLPSPRFNGLTNVLTYSESSFRSIVMDDPTNTDYIVMFDARWATGIEYVKAIFAELSLKYTTDTTVFIHVDLSSYPSLARDLAINIDGYAGEIPVFIAFRKGKEVNRIPSLSEKPRIRSFRWSKTVLCNAFSLDHSKTM